MACGEVDSKSVFADVDQSTDAAGKHCRNRVPLNRSDLKMHDGRGDDGLVAAREVKDYHRDFVRIIEGLFCPASSIVDGVQAHPRPKARVLDLLRSVRRLHAGTIHVGTIQPGPCGGTRRTRWLHLAA